LLPIAHVFKNMYNHVEQLGWWETAKDALWSFIGWRSVRAMDKDHVKEFDATVTCAVDSLFNPGMTLYNMCTKNDELDAAAAVEKMAAMNNESSGWLSWVNSRLEYVGSATAPYNPFAFSKTLQVENKVAETAKKVAPNMAFTGLVTGVSAVYHTHMLYKFLKDADVLPNEIELSKTSVAWGLAAAGTLAVAVYATGGVPIVIQGLDYAHKFALAYDVYKNIPRQKRTWYHDTRTNEIYYCGKVVYTFRDALPQDIAAVEFRDALARREREVGAGVAHMGEIAHPLQPAAVAQGKFWEDMFNDLARRLGQYAQRPRREGDQQVAQYVGGTLAMGAAAGGAAVLPYIGAFVGYVASIRRNGKYQQLVRRVGLGDVWPLALAAELVDKFPAMVPVLNMANGLYTRLGFTRWNAHKKPFDISGDVFTAIKPFLNKENLPEDENPVTIEQDGHTTQSAMLPLEQQVNDPKALAHDAMNAAKQMRYNYATSIPHLIGFGASGKTIVTFMVDHVFDHYTDYFSGVRPQVFDTEPEVTIVPLKEKIIELLELMITSSETRDHVQFEENSYWKKEVFRSGVVGDKGLKEKSIPIMIAAYIPMVMLLFTTYHTVVNNYTGAKWVVDYTRSFEITATFAKNGQQRTFHMIMGDTVTKRKNMFPKIPKNDGPVVPPLIINNPDQKLGQLKGVVLAEINRPQA
jgi:hypothetical protein